MSVRQASAMTTALSPDSRILIQNLADPDPERRPRVFAPQALH
jgi:hypothetical protein